MQRTLQLVEHVSAKTFRDGLAFDDRADERGLGLEHRLDEIVDRVLGDEVGDVDGPGLADPVRAVLGLPVIGRHPVEVVEHDLRRRGQIQPGAARDDVRQRTRGRLPPAETDRRRSWRFAPGVLPGEHDRSRAELLGELLNRIVEAREDDHFLALIDRASHEVERRGCFRNRERLPRFGEKREQLSALSGVGRLRRPGPCCRRSSRRGAPGPS